MIIHQDNRRTLYDWASGDFKSAKAVIVHEAIVIGDHHHNKKTEEFLLLTGSFLSLTLGNETVVDIPAPHKVVILPGTYHAFICSPGSILLGVATDLFDINDEIK